MADSKSEWAVCSRARTSRSGGFVNSGRRKTKAVTRLGVRARWEEELILGKASSVELFLGSNPGKLLVAE